MSISTGLLKQVAIKKESAFGVAAGASGAQLLRRVTSTLDIQKQTYKSDEIRLDQQIADFRHGPRSAPGQIEGQLSPKTYSMLLAAILRKGFVSGATTGAVVTVTAAAGPPGTFTRSAGSFLTDGFKIGDVVRWTGWATTGAANNNRNYRIVALTATVMTVTGIAGEVVAAKAAGDSVTCTVVGQKSFAPLSGQTDDSFNIEHWFPDNSLSELYLGNKVSQIAINIPPTGMAGITIQFVGQNMQTAAVQYFTTPTAQTTTGQVAAVNGTLRVNGVDVATVTGLTLTIDAGVEAADPTVGSNIVPAIFQGNISVSGQLTAYFDGPSLRDNFFNEDELSLHVMLTTSNAVNADFIVFNLPRIKLSGANKTDVLKGITQTLPFQALLNVAGGTGLSTEATTISIQDSMLP